VFSILFRGSCTPGAAALARRSLRALCESGVIAASVVDDLTLAGTELITNAVHAHATELEVVLTVHGAHVELAVHDDAPGAPTPRDVGLLSTSGRGLRIVEAVALTWGYRPSVSGKTVWATFSQPV
jgi:anti-sigma regulatory factor (Ser/Thr protein kinase)